jgi:hypothetical protein
VQFTYTEHFKRAFKKLPTDVQNEANENIAKFCSSPNDCPPEFQDKKLENQKTIKASILGGKIRSFRGAKGYRIIYEKAKDQIAFHLIERRDKAYS